MSHGEVAAVYAEAFVATGLQQGVLDDICSDMDLIDDCFGRRPDLVVRLAMPSLSTTRKNAVLEKVFGPVVTPLTLRFMQLLVRRGRVRVLAQIAGAVRRERDRVEAVSTITVTSARPFADDEKKELEIKLRRQYGPACRIGYAVDASLVAGYRIAAAGHTADYSVRSGLALLRQQLMRA